MSSTTSHHHSSSTEDCHLSFFSYLDHHSFTLLPVLSSLPRCPSFTPAQKNHRHGFDPSLPLPFYTLRKALDRIYLWHPGRVVSRVPEPPLCCSLVFWLLVTSILPGPFIRPPFCSNCQALPTPTLFFGRIALLFQQGLKATWTGTLSVSYHPTCRLPSCHEGRVSPCPAASV